MYYQCSNVYCGHTFVALLEVTGTLSASAIPDPKISLPIVKKKTANPSPERLK